MIGVEILSSEIIYNTLLPEWCFIVGTIFMFVALFGVFMCLAEDFIPGVWICSILTAVLMIFTGVSGMADVSSIHHIEYKVTIDESVSMIEFLDKYEILDQEGKIYTIREKE